MRIIAASPLLEDPVANKVIGPKSPKMGLKNVHSAGTTLGTMMIGSRVRSWSASENASPIPLVDDCVCDIDTSHSSH
jgi:hypothetical protein